MTPKEPCPILFCIDSLVRGGTELQLIGLINRLDRTRFRPFLLTIRPTPPELVPSDCVHLDWYVPRLVSPRGILALFRLASFLRFNKIQIVQTFFQDSTILGGAAARMANVPVRLACFRDLGFWRTRLQTLLLHRIYPLMTGFLCNSKIIRDNFVKCDGLDASRFSIIHNGIHAAALPWVEHLGPSMHIGLLGNFNRQVKRADLFIRAAGQVAQDHPEVTWHLVGDGHFRNELEELAEREILSGKIIFEVPIENVGDFLEKLQVGVLCSDSEGFSNALLEYMFKGCAVVATAVGGNVEVVENEYTGLLVPPGDVEALAAALGRMVTDVELRQRLAYEARAFVESNFSWEICLDRHMAVFEQALSASNTKGEINAGT